MTAAMLIRTTRAATLALGAACIVLAGCGKRSAPETAENSAQYPGYQQVAQSGDAAQLWFNPSDIKRERGGFLIHALKTIPGGYARFDVATNCQDLTQRLPGTQYGSDGTAQKDYPGNDSPIQAKSEPGMGEFMNTVCPVAFANQAIDGDFNVPAALELLYGPYDPQQKTATWTDAAIPPDLPGSQNFQFSPGTALSVSSIAVVDFTENSKKKKVLVTNAVPGGGSCHACTGLLGVAVFVQDGNKWKIESNHPYVASLGAMGQVGDRVEWIPAGDNAYALVVMGDDVHQGYQTASTDIFLRDAHGEFVPVISDGDTGVSDQEQVTVATDFIRKKDPQHYDAKVSFSYGIPGQQSYVASHVYQWANDKYVLAQKDDPPSFSAPTPDGNPGNPVAQASAPTVVGVQQSAGPHKTYLTSFVCANATHADEQAICGNADLAAMDLQMSEAFGSAMQRAIQPDQLRAAQSAWRAQRRRCASNLDCLRQAYGSRIEQLRQQ